MKHGRLLAVTLFLVLAMGASSAQASTDTVCPAVYPCDQHGEILDIYETLLSTCGDQFRLRCKEERMKLRKDCEQAGNQANEVQEKYQRLESRFISLQKRFRRLKSARR